jgi:hypothetical protein
MTRQCMSARDLPIPPPSRSAGCVESAQHRRSQLAFIMITMMNLVSVGGSGGRPLTPPPPIRLLLRLSARTGRARLWPGWTGRVWAVWGVGCRLAWADGSRSGARLTPPPLHHPPHALLPRHPRPPARPSLRGGRQRDRCCGSDRAGQGAADQHDPRAPAPWRYGRGRGRGAGRGGCRGRDAGSRRGPGEAVGPGERWVGWGGRRMQAE